MYEILKVNMVKVFLYHTVLFTTSKEGWYHIFIIWFIQCSKSSQMRYRTDKCRDCFLQLTAGIKSACKAACWGNAQCKNCKHVHSIRQLTIHADVHESKCGYSLPLLHSPIYYLVKKGWYHIFIIWVIKSGHAMP